MVDLGRGQSFEMLREGADPFEVTLECTACRRRHAVLVVPNPGGFSTAAAECPCGNQVSVSIECVPVSEGSGCRN